MTDNLKDILKLLKTGNFTIYCSDSGRFEIYEGKYTEKQIEKCDKNGVAILDPKFEIFDYREVDGYITPTLWLLTNALGGKVYTV